MIVPTLPTETQGQGDQDPVPGPPGLGVTLRLASWWSPALGSKEAMPVSTGGNGLH